MIIQVSENYSQLAMHKQARTASRCCECSHCITGGAAFCVGARDQREAWFQMES